MRETGSKRILKFLHDHADTFRCDACIAAALGLRGRRAVWTTSKSLENKPPYRRGEGVCPICGDKRVLIGVASGKT